MREFEQEAVSETLTSGIAQSQDVARTRGGLLFLLSFLIFLISFSYLGRQEVVKVWPASVKFYETLGISTAHYGAGMKLINIQPTHLEEGNKTILIIRGDVMNTSKEVQVIPPVKIELLGACETKPFWSSALSYIGLSDDREKDQCVLKEWQHSFAESRLLPGEKISFETEPKETVAKATNFRVHF